MQAQAQQTLMNRLMGIITFKSPVYKEVAEDPTATTPAALIVIVVSILVGVIGGLIGGGNNLVFSLISAILIALISWVVGSFVLAFVAKQFFKGDTNTSEMLRVTGHTYIFNIIAIIPFLGIIGSILQIVANIIGIREAAGFDTTKAILTAIISGIIVFIVSAIITAILAAIFIVPAVLNSR